MKSIRILISLRANELMHTQVKAELTGNNAETILHVFDFTEVSSLTKSTTSYHALMLILHFPFITLNSIR